MRLYVDASLEDRARFEASEGQAHYLLHVMRARAGDRVSLFNGRDGEWLAHIAETTKRSCVFGCERQTRAADGGAGPLAVLRADQKDARRLL